ncbi:MAG: transposase [Bacilli bacterium]|nr:transposase [Bacilli bacterium]
MNVIKRTYRFRLYPDNYQKELIEKTLGCSRQIYNAFLSLCKSEYEKDSKYSVKKFDLIKLLPKYKEEYPYLKEVDSIALQQTVIHLFDAYLNFFRGKTKFPVFKKKKNDYGYTTMNVNNSVRIIRNEIQIPKIGRVKFVYHRPLPESFVYSMVSVSRIGKYYFVSLLGEEEYQEYQKHSKDHLDLANSIGLDFSLANLYVSDSKTKSNMPKYYESSLTKLAKEQRKLSHMVKGSSNYKSQLLRITNLHERITNQRKDYLHKTSRYLANTYDYVFVESLVLKEMAKRNNNLKLGIFINDLSYGAFLNQLKYKLEWLNKKLVKVDRYFPSSQLCFKCGYRKRDLSLNERNWTCPECGTRHNRDLNAAINIRNEGIRLVTNSN